LNAKLAGIVDELAYCAELVRQADRDRFVASLFAPAEKREALYGLYAFNAEIARVREAAHAALPGEIRLQWWSDVIAGERGGEARANPVAAALLTVMERYRLPPPRLIGMTWPSSKLTQGKRHRRCSRSPHKSSPRSRPTRSACRQAWLTR